MDAVLRDYRTAPISERERSLLALVERANRETDLDAGGMDCSGVRREDVQSVLEAGWSEQAVYDALTVCSLFNFYNTWVDATGVPELSEEEYAASGRRLAEEGYLIGAEVGA